MVEKREDASASDAHVSLRYPEMRLELYEAAKALAAAHGSRSNVPERTTTEFAKLDFGLKMVEELLFTDHNGREGVGQVFFSPDEADAYRAVVLHLITAYDEVDRAAETDIDVFDVPTWPLVTELASHALEVMNQNAPQV